MSVAQKGPGEAVTDLEGLALVLLHGSDALVLGVDVGADAGFHHRVRACWGLWGGREGQIKTQNTARIPCRAWGILHTAHT